MSTAVDLEKLCKQLEFYFSDSNLPYDKFLKKYVDGHDGWVPVQVFTKFNMLKTLGGSCAEIIKTAIKKSQGVIQLNEKENSVRRVQPMPTKESMIKRLDRTLYFKKVTLPESKLSADKLREAFSSFGEVLYFKLYPQTSEKTASKTRKNTGIVEFATEAQAASAARGGHSVPGFLDETFSFCSVGSVEKDKRQAEEAKFLKNFSPDKIFELHNLPVGTRFFDLRKVLVTAVAPPEKEDEKAVAPPEKEDEKAVAPPEKEDEKAVVPPEKEDEKEDVKEERKSPLGEEDVNGQADGLGAGKKAQSAVAGKAGGEKRPKREEAADQPETPREDGLGPNEAKRPKDGPGADPARSVEATPAEKKVFIASKLLKMGKLLFHGDIYADGEEFSSAAKVEKAGKEKPSAEAAEKDEKAPEGKKHKAYAVIRVEKSSKHTARTVADALAARVAAPVAVLLPADEARRKWIKSTRDIVKKRGGARKRRNGGRR